MRSSTIVRSPVSDRVFVDTNVLVYVHDADEPRKQALAAARLAGLDPSSVVISAQVLGEFFWVVTRRLRTPLAADAIDAAMDALRGLECVPIDAALVARAVGRTRSSQLAYWDALIVESALAAGCMTLLTEDLSAGTRYDRLTVVDPFA